MTTPPRLIEITVSPDGQTKLETRGFAGASCREASKAIEQALGLVESDRPTAGMHQVQSHCAEEQTRTGGR